MSQFLLSEALKTYYANLLIAETKRNILKMSFMTLYYFEYIDSRKGVKMGRLEEKIGRIIGAVHMEQMDRVPFVSSGSAVNAAITGVKLSDYCSNMEINMEAKISFQVSGGNK